MFHQNPHKSPQTKTSTFSITLTLKTLAAGFATLFAHPFRVLLNEAVVNTNPFSTIYGAYNKIFHDAHINLLRGTSSVGFQLIVKHYANEFFGHDTFLGRIAGLSGAIGAGVAVTPIEVAFMRKNTMRNSTFAEIKKLLTKPSLFKYNLPILYYFTARVTGFCFSVYGSNDLPFYQRALALLPSALITAITHKLVSIEITKDI